MIEILRGEVITSREADRASDKRQPYSDSNSHYSPLSAAPYRRKVDSRQPAPAISRMGNKRALPLRKRSVLRNYFENIEHPRRKKACKARGYDYGRRRNAPAASPCAATLLRLRSKSNQVINEFLPCLIVVIDSLVIEALCRRGARVKERCEFAERARSTS